MDFDIVSIRNLLFQSEYQKCNLSFEFGIKDMRESNPMLQYSFQYTKCDKTQIRWNRYVQRTLQKIFILLQILSKYLIWLILFIFYISFRFDASDLSNFIYSDQFLQLTTKLASPNIYGLGEQRKHFKLSTEWNQITLFNHDTAPRDHVSTQPKRDFCNRNK